LPEPGSGASGWAGICPAFTGSCKKPLVKRSARVLCSCRAYRRAVQVPLRHEPVAYSSTTVVSVLVYSFTPVRHRSPAVSLSVIAQTADGADASERRSALLESDRSSQWPTAAVRWVGHQLADRRAAPPAVARSIRSSCARRRAARTQAGQGGSRWPTPACQRLLPRTSF
jgi:hypothetical protein